MRPLSTKHIKKNAIENNVLQKRETSQSELITFYILIQVDAVTTRLIYSWVINMTETNNYEHLVR